MTIYAPVTNSATIVIIDNTHETYAENIIETVELMNAIKICVSENCLYMICITLWIYTAIFNMINTITLIISGELSPESLCVVKLLVFAGSLISTATICEPRC